MQRPPAPESPEVALWWTQVERFRRGLDAECIESGGRLSVDILREAAQVGLFAVALPPEHGGLGLGLSGACRLIARLAEKDRAVATSVGLHAGLGSRGLVRFGSDALKARYLGAMAEGRVVGAFAATEPAAGSDLMAIRTTGVLEGDRLRIDGEKCYVTNGGFADLFTVLVRTPGIAGRNSHSLVCIPRDSPGVEIGPEERKLGLKASSTVTVRFDGVSVPQDHILLPAGCGITQAHEVLGWGRTLMSAGCVGTGRTALAKTIEQVQQRVQFGRPLAHFEAVRSQVAAMAAELYAMEALVEATAVAEDAGEPIGWLSVQAKVFCSEGAFALCDRAVQLHGALGFIEDTGVARLLRDSRVTRIFEGANDVLLLHYGAMMTSGREFQQQPVLRAPSSPDALSAMQQIEQRVLGRVAALRNSFGIRVIHQQLSLQALARAHIAARTGQLALARAEGGDAHGHHTAIHAANLLSQRAADALRECKRSAELDGSTSRVFAGLCEGDSRDGGMPAPNVQTGGPTTHEGARQHESKIRLSGFSASR